MVGDTLVCVEVGDEVGAVCGGFSCFLDKTVGFLLGLLLVLFFFSLRLILAHTCTRDD